MVESHVDISADGPLGLHGRFGSDFEVGTVDVGFEFDALFGNFDVRETENLEATGVSEGRFMPGIKLGEAAGFLDKLSAWAKNKMIGVCQDGLRAKLIHLLHREGLHYCARGSADESGRLDVAVRRMDSTDASEALFLMNTEF